MQICPPDVSSFEAAKAAARQRGSWITCVGSSLIVANRLGGESRGGVAPELLVIMTPCCWVVSD